MNHSNPKFSVLACGSNSCGQLGIGHKDDVNTLHPVLFHKSGEDISPDIKVSKVVAGGNHSLLLTDSGNVYWAGDSPAEYKSSEDELLLFSEFDFGIAISEAAAGGGKPPSRVSFAAGTLKASIFVIEDATGQTRVWSYGAGHKGELGLGENKSVAKSLAAIDDFPPPGTKIVDLSTSLYHVVVVLDNGEVWGWGAGRKGQLGNPPEAVFWFPRRILGVPFPVFRAVCGREFTCFLGGPESDNIFILGSDKDGIQSKAPPNGTLGPWKDVGASWHNIYVLKLDGTILGWGKNNLGQLPPPHLTGVVQISVGSEHAVALDNNGAVTAWGWGKHGECGPGGDGRGHHNVIASTEDLPTSGSKIIGIGAGWATSWVIVENPTVPYHPS